MFRMWKTLWHSGGFAPLMDAPDAGAAGGSADPVDGGDGLPPSDVNIDAADGAQPPAGSDDDDEDDDDPDLREDAEVSPERLKRITAKLSKLKRRDRAFRVERARLRELRAQGVSLDDLIHGTRQHRHLAEQIANNPTLRKLVHGDEADDPATRREPPAREPDPDDADFDETALPINANDSEVNKYFVDLARDHHELKRTAKQLQARLDAMEGKDTARTVAEQQRVEVEEKRTWKGAIDAAAKDLPKAFQNVFKDAMTAAFHGRRQHKQTPQQIIAHYLKDQVASGEVTNRQAAAATAASGKTAPVRTAATQQRIAEQNKTLPRTVAPAGTPASARTGKESLQDVRRRLTGRTKA
jgi:hypothetical protein